MTSGGRRAAGAKPLRAPIAVRLASTDSTDSMEASCGPAAGGFVACG
ncbi:hypothetical protein C7S16_2049 [Burkholderia thailandensis]|uniref:Uncharacterized protein n=1 Tax=Burkholderia thailandensis TaxID=57975 RepID=A0AAW9D3G1_BURTH|nr:hypothetical protein [Burkholderia thailandensis]